MLNRKAALYAEANNWNCSITEDHKIDCILEIIDWCNSIDGEWATNTFCNKRFWYFSKDTDRLAFILKWGDKWQD